MPLMNPIDQYAVFGQPIKHSKSPRIHHLFAQQTEQELNYSAQEVAADSFDEAVDRFFGAGGKGLNCTVPLKELAWKKADRLTERALISRAVNTLVMRKDGCLLGDNTDGIGLVTDLNVNHHIELTEKRILILGAGGATRGIISPLLDQQPHSLIIANRTVTKAEKLAEEFVNFGKITGCGFDDLKNRQFDLILNATSASLSNELPPLPDRILAENGCCYDLAYGNEETAFVRWGTSQHAAKSLDGLGMLVEQAAEAFFLWRHVRPQTEPVIALLNQERNWR